MHNSMASQQQQQQHQKAEERKLENTIEALIQRVNDIKASINQFLWKLDHEHEHLNWPSVLDNFALLSSHISSFQRLMANDKTAAMRNYVMVPLLLSPDRDQELEKLTENRVAMFNHEIVPDYLRTKPEIDVENKVSKIAEKASTLSADQTSKQINALNKICNSLLTLIQNKRDEYKNEEGQRRLQESTSVKDTMNLVAATSFGKDLHNSNMMRASGTMPGMRSDMPPTMAHAMAGHMPPGRQAPVPTINMGGKAPSSMRPNIRMQSQYPYQRP